MARIRTSVNPVNVFSKYTIKQLHEKIKSYNIPNYARLKKTELIQYLDSRFILNGEMLVLKQNQLPNSFQTNNEYFDLFNNFDEPKPLMQSMDLPVALKRPPSISTKGNRKILQENRKRVPTGRPRGRPRKVPV